MLPGLCLALLFSAGFAFSLPTLTKSASTRETDYSKEPAIVQEFHSVVRLENDGTRTRETKVRVLVQSDAGVKQYGLLSFGYESATERLQIEYVKVVKPNGKMVATPSGHIQDVTSPITREAPMYSDYREKQVAVRGLDVGDVLEYATRLKVIKPLVEGQFWFDFNFLKTVIALHEELEVSVPGSRKIIVRSPKLKPVITEQGKRRVYSWKTANLKDRAQKKARGGRLPPPEIEITSFENWAQVGSWWGQLETQESEPTPAIRSEALQLTKNATTAQEKIAAIYKYVSEQFRYISISFGIGRYKPHSATEVLNNQYGDCKDKQTLLSSLLQAVGLKEYPALISASYKVDPNVPSPGQFDHVISVVPLGQKLIWMDTTAEVAPEGFLMPSLLGKQALLIPDGEPAYLTKTPSSEPFRNTVRFDAEGTLSKDGTFTGKIDRSSRGYSGVLMRLVFRNISESQWQKAAQAISRLSGFGGKVSNVTASSAEDIDHPFHFSYSYVRKNYGDWKDHKIVPALPPLLMPDAKKSKGKTPTPIYLDGPSDFKYTSKIELPKGYSPQLPKPVNVKFDFGEYHATYTFEKGDLITKRDLTIKARKLPASNRKEYLKLRRAVTSDEGQFITLNTGPSSNTGPVNPQAVELLKQAMHAMQIQDVSGAEDLVRQALKLDPKFDRTWTLEGDIHLMRGEYKEGYADLRKAIALNPNDLMPYWDLAQALESQGKHREAIQPLQKVVELVPNNSQAHLQLGRDLLAVKEYAMALPQLQAVMAMGQGSPSLEMSIARAYAGAGDATKAADAFKKVAADNPSSSVWKQAAKSLAKFKGQLPVAQHYAEMAVKADEAEAAKLTIANASAADFSLMRSLASDWDTLGWVYFKENSLTEAEKYLQAAWSLSQYSEVGDHLGQVYEKLGNRQAAIKMYASAGASSDPGSYDARTRLSHLLGNQASKVKAAVHEAGFGNTSGLRVQLGKLSRVTGYADFLILFSSGSKVDGLKFTSGNQQLKTAGKAISSAKFHVLFPDNSPTRILRQGALVCIGQNFGCHFTLSPLDLSSESPNQ